MLNRCVQFIEGCLCVHVPCKTFIVSVNADIQYMYVLMHVCVYLHVFRRVVVARDDGYLILCKEDTENSKLSDTGSFDNRQTFTSLPVRSVSRFPEQLPILCITTVSAPQSGHTKWNIWCGTYYEMIICLDVNENLISSTQKLYHRSRYEIDYHNHVASIVATETQTSGRASMTSVWAFTRPSDILYCWDTIKERILSQIDMKQYSPDPSELIFVCVVYVLKRLCWCRNVACFCFPFLSQFLSSLLWTPTSSLL